MGFLEEHIARYGIWRRDLCESVQRYGRWLADAELSDAAMQSRIDRIGERLARDRISIAFVAEFSRGKSELINAIFFADHGQRILPSSAGRTTMCPTELLYDRSRPSSIRLLPIETRLRDLSVSELRQHDSEWRELPIDQADPVGLAHALASVRETIEVDVAQATLLGMFDADDAASPVRPDQQGRVEVPRWRHAIVNYPHPLLELGLVIIDTPGLNAIGAEPELTLKLIPGADAVLFVLAADAGVTRTDIDVWRAHISASHKSGRFVVLNKIDGLWDGLKDEVQVQLEIASQVSSVAYTLDLPNDRIYPVSAQKALVARINRDQLLLKRSRISDLEYALGRELVPAAARDRPRARRPRVRRLAWAGVRCAGRSAAPPGRAAVRAWRAARQEPRRDGSRGCADPSRTRGIRPQPAPAAGSAGGSVATLAGAAPDGRRRVAQGSRAPGARSDEGQQLLDRAARRHERAARGGARRLRPDHAAGRRDRDADECDVPQLQRRARPVAGQSRPVFDAPLLRRTRPHRAAAAAPVRRDHAGDHLPVGADAALLRVGGGTPARGAGGCGPRNPGVAENRDVADRNAGARAPDQLKQRLDSVRRILDANESLESRIAEIERQRAEVEQRIALAEEFALQARRLLGEGETIAEVAAV